MKVLDWTETFGIYSKLILASVVPSIVPICKNLATQKSFSLNRMWSVKIDKHITHAMDVDNTFP